MLRDHGQAKTELSAQDLHEQVKYILLKDRRNGYSRRLKAHFDYIKPAHRKYPYQYLWDTCLIVMILCDLEQYSLAEQQLNNLFQAQRSDGFIGHIIYWKNLLPEKPQDFFQARTLKSGLMPEMSALIQPPLLAQALERIYQKTKDVQFVNELLPKIEKYIDWIANNRDFDGGSLITIITSFESGMDYKPSYDALWGNPKKRGGYSLFVAAEKTDFNNFIRGYNLQRIYQADKFLVKDVLVNTIYSLELSAIANLESILGHKVRTSAYQKKADKVAGSILEKMYDADEQAFFDLAGRQEKMLKTLTPTAFYPLALKNTPKKLIEDMIGRHFSSSEEFHCPFPIPSLAINDKAFSPIGSRYLWRGPTWMLHNWFLEKHLRKRGYAELADELFASSLQLIKDSGFREYYNPFTGEGYGAKDFTWCGLVVDMGLGDIKD